MIRGFSLSGLHEMKRKIAAFQAAFPDHVKAGLYQEAQIEMTESKKRCPVDMTKGAPHRGLLRSTGRVHEPERHGTRLFVRLTYGTDYAVWVHEILENHHEVGQARFLSSVLEESRPYMGQRVANRVRINKMRIA